MNEILYLSMINRVPLFVKQLGIAEDGGENSFFFSVVNSSGELFDAADLTKMSLRWDEVAEIMDLCQRRISQICREIIQHTERITFISRECFTGTDDHLVHVTFSLAIH